LARQKGQRTIDRKYPDRTPKRPLDRWPHFISAQGLLRAPHSLKHMPSNIGQLHSARFAPGRNLIERDIQGASRRGFD